MASAFSQVLNMSMTGSVVILLVILARLILKRSPKIFSYALWSVVLFRLLCPVSLSAPVSVLKVFQPEVQETSESTSVVYYLPAAAEQTSDFTFVPAENQSENQNAAGVTQKGSFDLTTAASYVWIAGTAVMILYSAVQYIRLRVKLIGAMVYRGNVYLADYIDSPFVMGVLRPRIYLPSTVPMKERKFIIAHERHHIRRFDHVVKLLAYLSLCIHWFNPLVWAAFILAGKDMEMSCDEAVIRKLGTQIRADYSASLLRLATHRKIIAGMPLAFGEGDTKGRVMNMAKWKKPKAWVSVLCVILCIGVLAACAVNPGTTESQAKTDIQEVAQTLEVNAEIDPLPENFMYVQDEDGSILFMDGENVVGGIVRYLIPDGVYDADDSSFFWLEKVGIPDYEDAALILDGCMTSGDGWLAEFKSNVSEGEERTVYRRHHFYPRGDSVYDIWFDRIQLDYETTEELRVCVNLPAWETADSIIKYGDLRIVLTDGFYSREGDQAVILMKDGTDVGGITCWNHPGFEPTDMIEWMRALGLPELQEDYSAPIGYMAGGSIYGDMGIEIFQDGNPEELNVQHEFFLVGDLVYDVYYDQNLITDGLAERFLKTIQISGEPVVAAEALDAEAEAFEKCNAVFEAVQSESYHIRSDMKQVGDIGIVTDTERQYLHHHNGDWLNIFDIDPRGLNLSDDGDYTARLAFMHANGTYYTNEGSAGDAYTDIDWQVDEYPEDPASPWLASFLLVKSSATYMDTLTDDEGECVMFRIDKRYTDRDGFSDSYFANFHFDPDGNFIQVRLQVNAFLDNEFTVTESIVSMDPDAVNAEIQKEYQRAIG